MAAPLVGLAGEESSLPMAIVMVVGASISITCLVLAGRRGAVPAAVPAGS